MKREMWQSVVDDTWAVMNKITETKGREYSGEGDDQLANFKRNAEALGCSPLTVWAVPFDKHCRSITTYIRDHVQGKNPEYAEPIFGRIDDAICYLILLKALLIDLQLVGYVSFDDTQTQQRRNLLNDLERQGPGAIEARGNGEAP